MIPTALNCRESSMGSSLAQHACAAGREQVERATVLVIRAIFDKFYRLQF